MPVGPGPEQPPNVLVGGVSIAGSIPEMMPADGNAATAALFLQEELTVAAPEEGVSLVIPQVVTVDEEIPRVDLKMPTAQPEAKGGNVLRADILKPTTIRRSCRSKAKADEHTLQKIERMAAKKNLESPGTSFTSFSDSRIVSNLGRVGINLGSSDDIVKASIVSIKNLEIDKLLVQANKKSNLKSDKLQLDSDDEREARLDAVLSHACGNLNENMQDVETDLIIDLSPVHRKKKI